MKQFLTKFTLLVIIAMLINSCGGSPEIYKDEQSSHRYDNYKKKGSIVSVMLEQARQNYISALAKIMGDAGVKIHLHVFTDGRDCSPETGKGLTDFTSPKNII